jgi:hypothetical protein
MPTEPLECLSCGKPTMNVVDGRAMCRGCQDARSTEVQQLRAEVARLRRERDEAMKVLDGWAPGQSLLEAAQALQARSACAHQECKTRQEQIDGLRHERDALLEAARKVLAYQDAWPQNSNDVEADAADEALRVAVAACTEKP